MFGRRAAVLLRFPLHHRLPLPSALRHQPDAASRAALYHAIRTYATPGRPRNVVGEPSKPVKRSVKRAAPKATDAAESPAKRKVEAKKAKAKAKPKPKAKPKAKAAKPKKELTVEQKERKAASLEKKKVLELKKLALKPPVVTQSNAYIEFFKEKSAQNAALKEKLSGGAKEQNQRVAEHGKAVGAAWKELAASDVEVCHSTGYSPVSREERSHIE